MDIRHKGHKGMKGSQPLRFPSPAALSILLLLGGTAPLAAQPGSLAAIDQEALAMPAGSWIRLGSEGTPETARYALYQYREPVRFLLHWQPREAMDLPPPRPTEERQAFATRLAHASGRTLQEPLEPAGEYRGHEVTRGRLYELDVPAGELLIWDCPQSGRLMAAELGLDLIWEADHAWMPILEAIAGTVGCHGPIRPAAPPHRSRCWNWLGSKPLPSVSVSPKGGDQGCWIRLRPPGPARSGASLPSRSA